MIDNDNNKRKEKYIYGRIIYDRIENNEIMRKIVKLFKTGHDKGKYVIINKDARIKRSSIEIDKGFYTNLKPSKIKKEINKIIRLLRKNGVQDIFVHIVTDEQKKNGITYYRLENGKRLVVEKENHKASVLKVILVTMIIATLNIILIYLLLFVIFPDNFITENLELYL